MTPTQSGDTELAEARAYLSQLLDEAERALFEIREYITNLPPKKGTADANEKDNPTPVAPDGV